MSPAATSGAKRRDKGFGAPVARTNRGPRPVERSAIYAYRAGAWLMGRLPVPIARGLVSVLLQASLNHSGKAKMRFQSFFMLITVQPRAFASP